MGRLISYTPRSSLPFYWATEETVEDDDDDERVCACVCGWVAGCGRTASIYYLLFTFKGPSKFFFSLLLYEEHEDPS